MIKNVKKSDTREKCIDMMSCNSFDNFAVDLWKRSENKRLSECIEYINDNVAKFLTWDTHEVSFYEVMTAAHDICLDLHIMPSKENKMLIIEHMFEMCEIHLDFITSGGKTRHDDDDF